MIEAKQGIGNAPAYRGLAYLVFEHLPLETWGNRIPQFSCEVLRPVGELERAIRAVTIIPGASEHGLDPEPVRERLRPGEDRLLNRNILHGASDFAASLDELTALCPRLERAALVVSWFGTDLRAGSCAIRPGVETAARDETVPWHVGPTGREAAHLVSRHGGGPAYGGTPSDAGTVRAIRDLKSRGLKVTYYPFILMDVPAENDLPDPYGAERQAAYPWRGRITLDIATGRLGTPDGTAPAGAAIARFVGTARPEDFSIEGGEVAYAGPVEWSYRRMVLHQAHLAKLAGGVDAFLIGSELRGLTRIRDAAGRFPFVDALCALAADVAAVLPEAKLTYGADWSEYFGYQPDDGSGDIFFNLDPLWAHPAIGMVGIDNYLPLADARDGEPGAYEPAALRQAIAGGEYFDWFYESDADRRAGRRRPITDGLGKPWLFRPKDIRSWWENAHFERRGGVEQARPTPWQPRGKPIWFTELGCPAVDKGANQPNVFVDPKSSESELPYFSEGRRDDLIQRRVLDAHLGYWDPAARGFVEAANPVSPIYGGRMVEPSAIHLWTWDARPYPAFPARGAIWSDGGNWRRGHWLTGRLGSAPMDGLIAALLRDHGVTALDVEGVDALIGGYVATGAGSARSELEELLRLCGLVARAEAGRLVFRSLASRGLDGRLDALAEASGDAAPLELRRAEASEVVEEVVVGFLDPARAYQPATAEALRVGRPFPMKDMLDLPVVLDEEAARHFAGSMLNLAVAAQETARFALAPTAIAVEPGDVVALSGQPGRWLVTRIEDGETRRVEARRLPAAGGAAYGTRPGEDVPASLPAANAPAIASRPKVLFLDLPLGEAAQPEEAARIACFAEPFTRLAVDASIGGEAFTDRRIVTRPAMTGALVAPLPAGAEGLRAAGAAFEVRLDRGALFSITRAALLAGGNLAAVQARNGEWELLQFESAEEREPMRFRLRGLVRAQGGTEDAMAAGAEAGAPFVLLDGAAEPIGLKAAEIGMAIEWRIAPAGYTLDDPAVVRSSARLGRRAVRPLSPVHLRCAFQADGAAVIAWIRRTRIGGDGWDGLDVPLGEEIERYRVTIADGTGREMVRESDAPALALSAADQRAFFGALPARLDIRVAQFSLRHGAGGERRKVFARPAAFVS
ncbi:hypothetical protein GCM10011390_10170 [Aureimonas endophytica]|uniref:Tail protein n=1 Tax=Aureimonas endophytica TaxID=2027858 RepID=A0A916ZFI5_9HYPH|nr:glycoside hydrolase TIM-barrel-like domain-containing protein [Aureimonas endophytica]GGD93360.1 hypothetical protein GCM10011390_10170 [Aureimonas endophytica]